MELNNKEVNLKGMLGDLNTCSTLNKYLTFDKNDDSNSWGRGKIELTFIIMEQSLEHDKI